MLLILLYKLRLQTLYRTTLHMQGLFLCSFLRRFVHLTLIFDDIVFIDDFRCKCRLREVRHSYFFVGINVPLLLLDNQEVLLSDITGAVRGGLARPFSFGRHHRLIYRCLFTVVGRI